MKVKFSVTFKSGLSVEKVVENINKDVINDTFNSLSESFLDDADGRVRLGTMIIRASELVAMDVSIIGEDNNG